MAEVTDESTKVWVSKPRIAVFLAEMRHFAAELTSAIDRHRTESMVMVEPGKWQLRETLRSAIAASGVALDEREDRHFLCSTARFERHAFTRKSLLMESFYREQRRTHGVLMDGDAPAGGA